MDDIRINAEKRAANPSTVPAGAAFETERQKQKAALVRQLDELDPSRVRKISAYSETSEATRELRVAAYCRVSTDDIDQAISISLQMKQYKEKIQANPNWKYAGTYVDNGFSGTNTAHRPGFLKLIEDARAGKFDMIITKAVSRFARNLLDCIGYIEELKNLDPPVRVFFEQENLDTGLQTSGIILFVLAMVAEEESHMKSEAMLLSLEWRFSRGRFMTPALFGYDKVEIKDEYGGKRKILQINQPQAQVVKWMYATLLNGGTPDEIAARLTELQIPTGGRKRINGAINTEWSKSGVVSLMRNERYCGDVLARKTYTPNFKDHKSKKNNGKKNKYFQPDHHDAIVTRAIWNAAQRILNSRRFGHEGEYLPMRVIDRGVLTGFISMNRSWAGFEADDYFRVSQIAMGILDDDLESDLENEYIPDGGHRLGGMIDDHGISRIARELTEAEQQIKDELEGKDSENSTLDEQAQMIKTYQVVSGDMFSKVLEPVFYVKTQSIHFNQSCRKKLDAKYVEMLFNPVERMIIVRACDETDPNAFPWDGKSKGASSLCRILYDSLGWDKEYNYSVPCQELPIMMSDSTINKVLVFDLDNYIGKAINKKDEIIIPKKPQPDETEISDDTKSFYFPPDAGDEPQELMELAEQVQQELELNKRIFGTPAFKHTSAFRNIDTECSGEEWFFPARPIDKDHKVSGDIIDSLMTSIIQNPPEPPGNKNGNEQTDQTIITISENDTEVD